MGLGCFDRRTSRTSVSRLQILELRMKGCCVCRYALADSGRSDTVADDGASPLRQALSTCS